MSKTIMRPVYGRTSSCSYKNRLEERKAKAQRKEHVRKTDKPDDFILYENSDSEDELVMCESELLNTSFNFVDYVKSREINRKFYSINREYGSRHILSHEMFRETPLSLGNVNKVFCSQWLSDRQIVFGTKCNRLMVYDVTTHKLDHIPSLLSSRDPLRTDSQPIGIYTVEINPSHTLLATVSRNSCDVAVYKLPTLDPVCVGESAHKDYVYDMAWVDDEFLVSGSKDTKLALWRITPGLADRRMDIPVHCSISATSTKPCKNSQKIRAISYNKIFSELAALSLNGYIHIWDAPTFRQKISRKLPSTQENVCLAVQKGGAGLYAVGCRSYTLLLDSRTLQSVKKVSSRYTGCGIRSAGFHGDILTIGTGVGMLLFYDIRAGKYLDSCINSSRSVILKASQSTVFPDEEFNEHIQTMRQYPAIYTHCYDATGTRLFTAGGPLPSSLNGHYAALWQ
ncbi:DDB1- and CUL4-associated factor 12 [Coccinella septempunctata]|uniref:DDB1- and CUL4-associated factor 12 n=1 Tax=Coccinella septempunctata TaxID=41139 RepID=UPI001D070986|nr:DDB1- and CUL4-associated factor 12 [Coccinella septempunctata]